MSYSITPYGSKKLKLAQFVLCVMIMFIHINGYTYFDVSDGTMLSSATVFGIDILCQGITRVAVPMFFLISGFLFFVGIGNLPGTPEDASQGAQVSQGGCRQTCITHLWPNGFWNCIVKKWRKRIWSILIPYLLWNTFWMIYVASISCVPAITAQIKNKELFECSISSVLEGIFLYRYAGINWFLFRLMEYMLLSPVLYLFLKKRLRGALTLTAILAVSYVQLPAWLPELKYAYLFCFGLGLYCQLHFGYLVNRVSTLQERIIALLLYAGIVVGLECAGFSRTDGAVFFIVLMACFWILMDCLMGLPLYGWMQVTFFIYQFHCETEQVISKLICIILPNSGTYAWLGAWINTILGPGLTIAVSLCLAYILQKKVPNLWRLISGNR